MRRTLVLAIALLLALTGCVPTSGRDQPSPSVSATPVFASDEEALAAAEKAYAAYEAAVDRSLQSLDATSLGAAARGEALSNAQAAVKSFAREGRRQVGYSIVKSVAPLDLSGLTNTPVSSGQVYGCLDVSGVDVVDSTGSSVTSSGRQMIYPTVVEVVWSERHQQLFVTNESVWDGDDFCD